MTDAEIRSHNRSYLGLDDAQYDRHAALIGQKMSQWPRSLKDYVQAQAATQGMSGDCLMCWVADWIKNNPEDDPQPVVVEVPSG